MQAIIATGGKQYVVSPGETIRVEKLAGELGSEIEIPAMVTFQDGGEMARAGAVKATITEKWTGRQNCGFQVQAQKSWQCKKTIGHRQSFTELKVGEIVES